MEEMPRDPVMLLSWTNMKLRDFYSGLDALCEDNEVDRREIEQRLGVIGYRYDEAMGQFR